MSRLLVSLGFIFLAGLSGSTSSPAGPTAKPNRFSRVTRGSRVALGMALVASRRFPEVGAAILPVVVAATVIFEVLGPLCTRYALERAPSEC